jgi:hypothetical protein
MGERRHPTGTASDSTTTVALFGPQTATRPLDELGLALLEGSPIEPPPDGPLEGLSVGAIEPPLDGALEGLSVGEPPVGALGVSDGAVGEPPVGALGVSVGALGVSVGAVGAPPVGAVGALGVSVGTVGEPPVGVLGVVGTVGEPPVGALGVSVGTVGLAGWAKTLPFGLIKRTVVLKTTEPITTLEIFIVYSLCLLLFAVSIALFEAIAFMEASWSFKFLLVVFTCLRHLGQNISKSKLINQN